MTISVSAYNRPEYLSRTLSALAACDGVEKHEVLVLLDPCAETMACRQVASQTGFAHRLHAVHLGCDAAIYASLAWGFEEKQSDTHIHLEDDTVPSPDALRWFEWGLVNADRARTFTVSGYNQHPEGGAAQAGYRKWFTPWGWACWRETWREISRSWASHAWDHNMNHRLRRDREELRPAISRIQNIGAEKGAFCPGPEFHAKHQHASRVAGVGDRQVSWQFA